MIKELIKAYHRVYNISRLKVIEELMGKEDFFRAEVACFDDGRVASLINRMKDDYEKIITEIDVVTRQCKSDSNYKERLNYLYRRQYEIIYSMSFQASQNLKNIDSSINLWGNIKDDFLLCLEGLKLYKQGIKEESFSKLTAYLHKHHTFGSHYLLNKVYGTLLYEKKQYNEAEIYLHRVTQICPEDAAVHRIMQEVYQRRGERRGAEVEAAILNLLEKA